MDEEEIRRVFDRITNNALVGLCLKDGLENVKRIEELVCCWEESVARGLVKRGIWLGYVKHYDECEGV